MKILFFNKIKIQKIEIGKADKRTTILDFIKRIIYLRQVVKKINPDVVIGFMSSIYVLFSLHIS